MTRYLAYAANVAVIIFSFVMAFEASGDDIWAAFIFMAFAALNLRAIALGGQTESLIATYMKRKRLEEEVKMAELQQRLQGKQDGE